MILPICYFGSRDFTGYVYTGNTMIYKVDFDILWYNNIYLDIDVLILLFRVII